MHVPNCVLVLSVAPFLSLVYSKEFSSTNSVNDMIASNLLHRETTDESESSRISLESVTLSAKTTSIIPVHRDILERRKHKQSSNIKKTDYRRVREQQFVDGNLEQEDEDMSSIPLSNWWIKLGEVGIGREGTIPMTRRAHSSTIYKPKDTQEEYMIISGGFTDEDWFTFPIWAYNMTAAIETGQGQWIEIMHSGGDSQKSPYNTSNVCNNNNVSTTFVNGKQTLNLGSQKNDAWAAAESCAPFSRIGHASVVHDDFLYIFGGLMFNEKTDLFEMDAEPYVYRMRLPQTVSMLLDNSNISSCLWERIVPKIKWPSGVLNRNVGIDELKSMISRGEVRGGHWKDKGKFIIHGGLHVSAVGRQQVDVPLGDVWSYDFSSAIWEMMVPSISLLYNSKGMHGDLIKSAQYPGERTSHAATVVGNELIVYGGLAEVMVNSWDGSTIWEVLDDVWVFDLRFRTWKERPMMPKISRSQHSLVGWESIDGSGPVIAAFGGYMTEAANNELLTYVFDDTLVSEPNNNFWLKANEPKNTVDSISKRYEHTAVRSDKSGYMFVWGGRFEKSSEIVGLWCLNLAEDSHLEFEIANEDYLGAYRSIYYLTTTVLFAGMVLTYMCGRLSRHNHDQNQDLVDDISEEQGESGGFAFFGREGLCQNVIESLPLKIYNTNDRATLPPQSSLLPGSSLVESTPSSPPLEAGNIDESFCDENCCAICLVDYVEGDKIRTLPCNHEYHMTCLDPWLKNNASCPTCRYSLRDIQVADTQSSRQRRVLSFLNPSIFFAQSSRRSQLRTSNSNQNSYVGVDPEQRESESTYRQSIELPETGTRPQLRNEDSRRLEII